MELDKVIAFDVWGRFAHFKKIYVTTSALSYGVPFKTSIYGLVGAILGLENRDNKYLNYFDESNCRVGIQIVNPIKFQRINTNLSVNPGPIGKNRKPTMMEYITNPHYRIYFWHSDDELCNKLIEHLESKITVYTPVLGLAHCIANFKMVGVAEASASKGMELIDTVIPKSLLSDFDQSYWIENEIHIQEQDMYPLEMNSSREVTKRGSILFDLNGKQIKAEVEKYYRIKTGNKNAQIMLM